MPKLIVREGPTGLFLTTTQIRLHPENETRMLCSSVVDTREQTAAILDEIAKEPAKTTTASRHGRRYDLAGLRFGRNRDPFAPELAKLVPPVAVRLRRDFGTVLMLIRAHALLHQATRIKDNEGRMIATIADYAAVRELVAEILVARTGSDRQAGSSRYRQGGRDARCKSRKAGDLSSRRRGRSSSFARSSPPRRPTGSFFTIAIAFTRQLSTGRPCRWGGMCSRHPCGHRKPMRSASG